MTNLWGHKVQIGGQIIACPSQAPLNGVRSNGIHFDQSRVADAYGVTAEVAMNDGRGRAVQVTQGGQQLSAPAFPGLQKSTSYKGREEE